MIFIIKCYKYARSPRIDLHVAFGFVTHGSLPKLVSNLQFYVALYDVGIRT